MEEQFRNWNPRSKIRIQYDTDDGKAYWEEETDTLQSFIEQIVQHFYHERDIKLTKRQLYYQLVGKDLIPNYIEIYKRICTFTTDMCYAGLLDWSALEDRGRVQKKKPDWKDIQDLIKSATDQYRLPRWEGQEYYVEMYVEKEAMESVLKPVADYYHIYFGYNKGYSGSSAMYKLAKRIKARVVEPRSVIILYLGDHDASVVGDTPILYKEKGKINLGEIKDIVEKIKADKKLQVLSLNEKTLKVEFNDAIDYFEHTKNNLYDISYTNGKITCTGDHSVYVFDQNSEIICKKAGDLKVGDSLITFCGEQLEKKKGIDFKISQKKTQWTKKINDTFHLNEDTAKLLGYYTAEGCVKRRKGRPVGVYFCFDDSETEYIAETERIVKSAFGISPTKALKNLYMSYAMAEFFLEQFPTNMAKTKRLPSFMWSAGKECVLSFLSGYNDGDGYIVKKPKRDFGTWAITSKSKWMIYDMVWLLRSHNIPCGQHSVLQKEHYKKDGCFMKGGMTYYLTIPSSYWREVKKTPECLRIPNLFKEYKIVRPRDSILRSMRVDLWKQINRENAENILKEGVNVSEYHNKLIKSSLGVARIKSIIKLDKEEKVYDITVKGASNFFGGTTPILLHNSGLDMSRDIFDRVSEFLTEGDHGLDWDPDFKVIPIALNKEQIAKNNLPPNPAKTKDPRFKKYIQTHGENSWELDALDPEVLRDIASVAVLKYLDLNMYNEYKIREEEEKQVLVEFGESLKENDEDE